ncbi:MULTISPECIES: sulfite exporter TauE/SafE family protein [unclassified Variovorax]|uniref:sulfite exporter TauE/SafE family protein n=1 Tax=unclassified Variovorax TaxID=663243 RepID=UPI001BD46353|nr:MULTISPECIES: sulfite exporter TauE/SafE family protein [unclassified Variovorax]
MTIWTTWVATAAVFVLAGMVKGVIGLGLPTVSMALLALWMPPAQAAALLIVPSLVTNAWQAGPRSTLAAMLRRLGGMQVGIVAGTLGGAVLFGAPAGAWASVLLGLALVGYAVWGLAGWRVQVPAGHAHWMGPVAGALTGLLTALTGVFVLPAVPYLQGLGLEKDELIQAMGMSFTTSTLALALGLALSGGFAGAALQASLPMLLPALLGMVAGSALRQRLPVAAFRRCFFVGLALLGAYMAGRQWAH